jgi:hypothetical protein
LFPEQERHSCSKTHAGEPRHRRRAVLGRLSQSSLSLFVCFIQGAAAETKQLTGWAHAIRPT